MLCYSAYPRPTRPCTAWAGCVGHSSRGSQADAPPPAQRTPSVRTVDGPQAAAGARTGARTGSGSVHRGHSAGRNTRKCVRRRTACLLVSVFLWAHYSTPSL
ncbi:hypothetical protein DPMN_070317 [Dreissena polymorpha]|uniref:Uncharacterized protein n=1 Tax=Dreissena polymorpha TaxID=45954 RepID=A0A9D4BVJ7_DREPO|nr:hypothetical protein DPMN_070317 [Dreissena polymorpha]